VILAGKMAPQVIIDFNELPVIIMVHHGMLKPKRNIQMVFTIGPRSILTEFPVANSLEPLTGLKREAGLSLRSTVTKADKPITKKAIKNLKRNKCKSD